MPAEGAGSLLERVMRRLDVQGTSRDRILRAGVEELGSYLGASEVSAYLCNPAEDALLAAGRWAVVPEVRGPGPHPASSPHPAGAGPGGPRLDRPHTPSHRGP